METKYCKKCDTEKLKSDFYKHAGYCKPCENKRATEYARLNKDRIKEKRYGLQYRYGITGEEYDLMLEQQNDRCAICFEECASGRKLAVDHDHKTGKVRGLLCSNCNTALGKFKDNEALLLNAISYLQAKR